MMIPFYIAVLRQVEMMCFSLIFLMIRSYITKESLFGWVPDAIRTPGWGLYFAFLWFGLFPYMIMRANLPHYGFWGYLYEIHPILGYLGFVIGVSISSYWLYRQHQNQ